MNPASKSRVKVVDPPMTWWVLPFIVGMAPGALASLAVRMEAAEYGAEMQRRCEVYCTKADLGHGTAEPKADACVCEAGGSQP